MTATASIVVCRCARASNARAERGSADGATSDTAPRRAVRCHWRKPSLGFGARLPRVNLRAVPAHEPDLLCSELIANGRCRSEEWDPGDTHFRGQEEAFRQEQPQTCAASEIEAPSIFPFNPQRIGDGGIQTAVEGKAVTARYVRADSSLRKNLVLEDRIEQSRTAFVGFEAEHMGAQHFDAHAHGLRATATCPMKQDT